MNNIWHDFKEHEARSRLSKVQRPKKDSTEYKQLTSIQSLNELEKHQTETRLIAKQQAREQKAHSEETRNTLLSQAAQELRIADQKRQEAYMATRQKRQHTKEKGSPIEAAFSAEWQKTYPSIELKPQYPIGKYRVDFAHVDTKIAIELDGHNYHSSRRDRTKDYRRQREIESLGWSFVRFTGSELFQDVASCVLIAWTRIENAMR